MMNYLAKTCPKYNFDTTEQSIFTRIGIINEFLLKWGQTENHNFPIQMHGDVHRYPNVVRQRGKTRC